MPWKAKEMLKILHTDNKVVYLEGDYIKSTKLHFETQLRESAKLLLEGGVKIS